MASQTFLERLRQSRLLSDEQLAQVERRFAANLPMHEVTTSLAEQGWLTAYQVKEIWAGRGPALTLGQYQILDELGRGGFGCVYKARHAIMNRVVALKVISPELVEDSRARSWFRREVLAATQLNHPNIAMAYDANEVGDVLFMAMEYVEGPNLDQLVRKQGPLPINLACAMLHQVARALQHAHERQMVHRDIKPANLLVPQSTAAQCEAGGGSAPLPPTPLVKIVDFGLARLHSGAGGSTILLHKEKGFIGTPDYISPEQARDVHAADIRSDLYSLGCTFYFALSGSRPFHGDSPMQTLMMHMEKEADLIEMYRPEVPPALASIIRRLMAKKPEHRFQTPADMAAELSFLFGTTLPAAPPTSGLIALTALKPSKLTKPMPRPSASQLHGAPLSAAANVLAPAGAHWKTLQTGLPEPPKTTVLPAPGHASPPVGDAPAPEVSFELSVPQPGARVAAADQTAPTLSIARTPRAIDSAVCDVWRDWAGVVEVLATGGKLSLSEAEYRALHARLLASCRTHKEGAAPQDVLQRIDNLAAPWLSLQTLAATDAPTLASLRQRCHALSAELGIEKRQYSGLVWAAALLALVGGAALVWLLGAGRSPRDWPALQALARFVTANPLVGLTLAVPLAAASLYLFARYFRS